ncbi:hypothetical protein C8A01DRAFT_39656 [Parachaetomium inaequale]|uniref:Uncharacterized protein n=1 Tax=Parachaetomium inaequale TaxID=2588326 RepID=A0AAN6PDA2_9PEZI|nr:hypothetical protein C8A01DRAFT_39656 [Parachaetomium inaequale]
MPATLTISRSGIKASRTRAGEVQDTGKEDDLSIGRPDSASLDQFVSKLKLFGWGKNKARGNAVPTAAEGSAALKPQPTPSATAAPSAAAETELSQSSQPPETTQQISTAASQEDAHDATRVSSSMPLPAEPLESGAIEKGEVANPDSTDSAPRTRPIVAHPAIPTEASPPLVSPAIEEDGKQKDTADQQAKPDSGVETRDWGEGLSNQAPTPGGTQTSLTVPSQPSASSLSLAGRRKGKGLARSPLGQVRVHVPLSRLERVKKVLLAGSDTIRAEEVEQSATNQERLRKFAMHLASPRDQIELFGSQLPQCRPFLVQVTEAGGEPDNYICIQGLRNQTEITRFHKVMSQRRYSQIYKPLKLCYDASRFSKVGRPDDEETPEPPRLESSLHKPFLMPTTLSDGMAAWRTTEAEGLETLYQYLPVLDNKTYCRALYRTLVQGRPWFSTIGGLVEVDGAAHVLSCEHVRSSPSPTTLEWTSDALAEEDFDEDVEGPLVFGELGSEAVKGSGHDDEPYTTETLDALAKGKNRDWESLPVAGAGQEGPEWCIIPLEGSAILPNFVEKPSARKGKGTGHLERYYLEQASEPRGGCPAWVVTGSAPEHEHTGSLLANPSYIIGGGSGMLEVWTVRLEHDQELKLGDSGSWVLDTSDPMQFKVLGSLVAASDGEAHFIPLHTQFAQIGQKAARAPEVSLAASFRALVNCAHLAGLKGDRDGAWFAEEMTSPHVLRQLSNGWYLPAFKSLLGVKDSGSEEKAKAEDDFALDAAHKDALKALLVRYGVSLIDGLLYPHRWIEAHRLELRVTEQRAYYILQEVVQPLAMRELARPKAQPARTVAFEDDDVLPTSRQHSHRRVTELSDKQANVGVPALGVILFLSNRRLLSRMLLSVIPMVLIGAIAGIAAIGVLSAAERQAGRSWNPSDGRGVASLGAVLGAISTSVWSVQILLLLFMRKYEWVIYAGRRECTIGSMRKLFLYATCVVASSFARTFLPALYLETWTASEEDRPMMVAAAAAAVALIPSTAAPGVSFYLVRDILFNEGPRRYGYKERLIVGGLFAYLATIGLDALAGYAFSLTLQRQGLDLALPSSGAATVGVFAAISLLAPLLYILLRATGARHLVEAGTSFGLSTIYLALAVGQNCTATGAPDKVIATENEPVKAVRAREYWRGGCYKVEEWIELCEGDLRMTLKTNLPEQVDFLLLGSEFS